jgi:hypothetical protein
MLRRQRTPNSTQRRSISNININMHNDPFTYKTMTNAFLNELGSPTNSNYNMLKRIQTSKSFGKNRLQKILNKINKINKNSNNNNNLNNNNLDAYEVDLNELEKEFRKMPIGNAPQYTGSPFRLPRKTYKLPRGPVKNMSYRSPLSKKRLASVNKSPSKKHRTMRRYYNTNNNNNA